MNERRIRNMLRLIDKIESAILSISPFYPKHIRNVPQVMRSYLYQELEQNWSKCGGRPKKDAVPSGVTDQLARWEDEKKVIESMKAKEEELDGLGALFGGENGLKPVTIRLSEQGKKELEDLKKKLKVGSLDESIRCASKLMDFRCKHCGVPIINGETCEDCKDEPAVGGRGRSRFDSDYGHDWNTNHEYFWRMFRL